MAKVIGSPERRRRVDWELCIRRFCALVVAGVAAFASFEHQRHFALRGGADRLSAWLWPFSVDGLLVLATVAMLKSDAAAGRRGRIAAWLSFGLGVAVSLAANVAAAPALEWQPILVAGWPPVALLLAVELLAHRSRPREDSETAPSAVPGAVRNEPEDENPGPSEAVDEADSGDGGETTTETSDESADAGSLGTVSAAVTAAGEPSAQEVMWVHYQREQARGRVPTGAELDRVAGTNNYGRTVLRQWREQGRIPEADQRNGRSLAVPAGRSGR
jgi:hypothetical protein